METIEEIQKWNQQETTKRTQLKRRIDKKNSRINANRLMITTVHFTEPVLEMMDQLVRDDLFPNRSEFIRHAVINELMQFYPEL